MFVVNGKVYINIGTVARKLDIDERSLREYLKQGKTLKEAIELCKKQRKAEKEEYRKNNLDKMITDKRVEKAQEEQGKNRLNKEITDKRAKRAEEEFGNLTLDDIINKAKSDDFDKDEP